MPVPTHVALSDIVEMSNVRTEYDQAEIESLAASILSSGVLQPLGLVEAPVIGKGGEPTGAIQYGLVFGHRRYRALKWLQSQRKIKGSYEVPAVEQDFAPGSREFVTRQLIENVQRADLSPIDEARGYSVLIEEQGLTQAAIAEQVGKSKSHVAKRVALLSLPPEVQALVGHTLSIDNAYKLSQLEEKQIGQVYDKIQGGVTSDQAVGWLIDDKAATLRARKDREKFKAQLQKQMIDFVKQLPAEHQAFPDSEWQHGPNDTVDQVGVFTMENIKGYDPKSTHIQVMSQDGRSITVYRKLSTKAIEKARAKEAADVEAAKQRQADATDRWEQERREFIESDEATPLDKWDYAADEIKAENETMRQAYRAAVNASLATWATGLAKAELGKVILAMIARQMAGAHRQIRYVVEALGLEVPTEDAEGNELGTWDRPWQATFDAWVDGDTSRLLQAWVAWQANEYDVELPQFGSFRAALESAGHTPPEYRDIVAELGPEPWYDEEADAWRTDDPNEVPEEPSATVEESDEQPALV